MRQTRQSLKRQHSPNGSNNEDKTHKKKSPSTNIQLSENSSSESDIETYLQIPSKLDYNSSFFNFPKTTSDGKNQYQHNTVDQQDNLEPSVEEVHEVNLNEIPSTSTINNFEYINAYNAKLEETKRLVEVYKAKRAEQNDNKAMIVDEILGNEEKAFYSSFGNESGFETLTDDENKSDWEEVEEKVDKSLKKKDVQITINIPGNCRTKKSLDLMAAIKRKMNRVKKENQVFVHKVHLLCWIAHGLHVNGVLNNQSLLATALSLLPSKHCYPPSRVDITYLENVTNWYKKMMANKNVTVEFDKPLEKLLEEQMLKKEAFNYKMYVYIFICILRSLGVTCRLVLSLQVEPLRPPQSELCSLSNKSKNEAENGSNIGESNKNTEKNKKKNKKKVTFNLSKSFKGDKSFNTSIKDFKKTQKSKITKKEEDKSNQKLALTNNLQTSSSENIKITSNKSQSKEKTSNNSQTRKSAAVNSKSTTTELLKGQGESNDKIRSSKSSSKSSVTIKQKTESKPTRIQEKNKKLSGNDNESKGLGKEYLKSSVIIEEVIEVNKTKTDELTISSGDDSKARSKRKSSKSPVTNQQGDNKSNEKSKINVNDSENRNSTRIRSASSLSTQQSSKSQPTTNKEVKADVFDSNARKRSTRKCSKSPVLLEQKSVESKQFKNVDNNSKKSIKTNLNNPETSEKGIIKSTRSSDNYTFTLQDKKCDNTGVKSANSKDQETDGIKTRLRRYSKSPTVESSENTQKKEPLISTSTISRSSKSPNIENTNEKELSIKNKGKRNSKKLCENEGGRKKEVLKVKIPIPKRLSHINNVASEKDNEESDDEDNKIIFVPPVIKQEPPSSMNISSEEEGFLGFSTDDNKNMDTTPLNSKNPSIFTQSDEKSENGFQDSSDDFLGFQATDEYTSEKLPTFVIPYLNQESQDCSPSNKNDLINIKTDEMTEVSKIPQLDGECGKSVHSVRHTKTLVSVNKKERKVHDGMISNTEANPLIINQELDIHKKLDKTENIPKYIIQDIKPFTIPQLDGGGDTPPKIKRKPNLANLKTSIKEKCPKVHLKRLKIHPTYKNIDSEDEFQSSQSSSSMTKTSPLKRVHSKFSTSSQDNDKSRFFDGNIKEPKQLDVRNDIVALVKGSLAQEQIINRGKFVKRRKVNYSSDDDSDYIPEKIVRKKSPIDNIFKEKQTTKVKRRIPMKKDLIEIEKKKTELKEQVKKNKEVNVWVEIFAEAEEKWISIDVIKGQVHCVKEIYSRTTHPVSYILGFDNDNHIKDITKRYCENWNTVTRKMRVDNNWWEKSLLPYNAPKTPREKEEDEDLARQQLDQPLPKTISEYKDHPLYVLKRHLLKFQAIYPPDALIIGFVRNEPVYSRECVYTLHSRDIWLKSAKVVKPGETPYKIVKARPKYDKLSNSVVTDQLLEIFGIWQVEDYVPPTAQNGIVPKNAYGNVDLFKPCMLPKGTVHLQFPALNKVARKLNIDCAPAVTGFDFHSGFSHPVFDGFVVCEEFSEQLVAAWVYEQEEYERKEKEKNEKRIYDNWKKLIKGLLIKERLNRRYDFGTSSASRNTEPKVAKKAGKKKIS